MKIQINPIIRYCVVVFSFSMISPGLAGGEPQEEKSVEIEALVEEARRMASHWADEIREMRSGGSKKTTYMGVSVESVPRVLRDYIDLPDGIGLLLPRIATGGPADKAGLKDNDILVTFGGQLMVNFSQLSTLIELKGPGAEVPVKVLRKGEEMDFSITLEERTRNGGRFPVPEAPELPEVPDIPDSDEMGRYLESIEEWIPGSVTVYVDEREQVHVELDDLKENIEDLRAKVRSLKDGILEEHQQITREYGDFGARKSIVHVADRNVNYSSRDGKMVLTSEPGGGEQVMIWNASGKLIYQGDLPQDYAGKLPQQAVKLIRAYEASRDQLQLDEDLENFEIHLDEESIEPMTHIDFRGPRPGNMISL